jgi:hypothetical protein
MDANDLDGHEVIVYDGNLARTPRREVRLSEQVRAVIRFVVEVMREHAEQLRGMPTNR